MNSSLYPCFWFDGNAGEALRYYCAVFNHSEIMADTPMVVTAELDGVKLMGLNGGPQFVPNATVSMMVIAESAGEVTRYWEHLSKGGKALMPLGEYPWSQKYGWTKDRFGIDWQIYMGALSDTGQRIVPTLMYCQEYQGEATEAIAFYLELFARSQRDGVMHYPDGPVAGQIQHAQFRLNDFVMMAMDSGVPQDFTFSEGVSFVIECKDQEEIDHYWNGFTKDGQESKCGWCRDPFGVWWQVIPASLSQLMAAPQRGQRVMEALMKMRKIDLGILERA